MEKIDASVPHGLKPVLFNPPLTTRAFCHVILPLKFLSVNLADSDLAVFLLLLLVSYLRLDQGRDDQVEGQLNHFIVITLYIINLLLSFF